MPETIPILVGDFIEFFNEQSEQVFDSVSEFVRDPEWMRGYADLCALRDTLGEKELTEEIYVPTTLISTDEWTDWMSESG